MTANLNLLPRKEFELVLVDGSVVPGQFGTWALNRFGQKRKIGLKELQTMFYKPGADGENVADPGYDVIIDYILAAIEYKARQAGKLYDFNELKLCKWADDTYDPTAIFTVFAHSASADERPDDEKKSQPESSGESYSDTQPVPVLSE